MNEDTSGLDRYERQTLRLRRIALQIAEMTSYKDRHYLSSWRKRGGVGAYMTFVRKWDRLQATIEDPNQGTQYDVFERFATDNRKESITNDCVDLIGYLLVLLEHMIEVANISDEEIDEITSILVEPRPEPDLSTLKVTDSKLHGDTAGVQFTGMEHPFGFDENEDTP